MNFFVKKGNALFRSGDYLQAIYFYNKAIENNPSLERILSLNILMCTNNLELDKRVNSQNTHKGITVALINTNYQTKNLHITRAIYNALLRHKFVQKVIYSDYFSLVEDCRVHKPNLLICIDGQKIMPELLDRASQYADISILWTFDDPYTTKDSLRFQGIFDFIFSNDEESVKLYDTEARHLPLASPIMDDFCLDNYLQNDAFDIFFCGTAWPNRVDDLNKLIKTRSQLKYKFSLPYNKHIPLNKLYGQPITSYIFPMNFLDVIRSAKQAKIVLGLHRSFGENKTMNTSNTPGPRIFEIAGFEAFQLVDMGCGVQKYYDVSNDLSAYEDFDDMIDKIDHFLKSEDERKRMASNGFSRTMSQHTYSHRISVVLSQIGFVENLVS